MNNLDSNLFSIVDLVPVEILIAMENLSQFIFATFFPKSNPSLFNLKKTQLGECFVNFFNNLCFYYIYLLRCLNWDFQHFLELKETVVW